MRRPRGARRGDVIDRRYLVEGTIGRGGMGRVLSVRHQVLGKSFALKLIKNRIAADERIRNLFYREGRLMSGLKHENICSIVDFGDDPTFGLFMVMELLEGQSLKAKLLYDGAFAPKVACDIAVQIAEAVRYIHRRGIIHSDLKSENILLTRQNDRRRVIKLLDFGLSRTVEGEPRDRVAGTPEYLAPERIEGQPASERSDIYALGVLFFELLTGRVPFHGEVDEIFEDQRAKPVPPPSGILGDKLDARADEIISRATAKDPRQRHEDVGSLVYELRTLLDMLGHRRHKTAPREPRPAAASEAFELCPLPLASVDENGIIVVANTAFQEFLGDGSAEPGARLLDTALAAVYPSLEDDLVLAIRGREIKRVIRLRDADGGNLDAAVVLSSPPLERVRDSGVVHIAVHPLARRH